MIQVAVALLHVIFKRRALLLPYVRLQSGVAGLLVQLRVRSMWGLCSVSRLRAGPRLDPWPDLLGNWWLHFRPLVLSLRLTHAPTVICGGLEVTLGWGCWLAALLQVLSPTCL